VNRGFDDKIFLGLKVHNSELGFMVFTGSFVVLFPIHNSEEQDSPFPLNEVFGEGGGIRDAIPIIFNLK
jgi:hypothetical protein